MKEKYSVVCSECGEIVHDKYAQSCSHNHSGLLKTEYSKKDLVVHNSFGIFRFSDWLPVEGEILVESRPVTFHNADLSKETGLSNLSLTFSGYFPEEGARMQTCSFKELEAVPTLQRMINRKKEVLIIASAGNTARAFAQVSAISKVPVILVVPENSLSRLWTTVESENILLITVKGDYSDAIECSRKITSVECVIPEGGARNIARRDGMATVLIDYVMTKGHLPLHYVQAIGSGTGAIAANEAAKRFLKAGRYGSELPHTHLAQNAPFTPMVSAWREGRRDLIPDIDMPDARESIAKVYADVLTNRNPPYSIRGGVFDTMTDSNGLAYAVTNEEARSAGKLFTDCLGVDPDPAAAVSLAALLQAVDSHSIKPSDSVLLNVTGGGYSRVKEDFTLIPVPVTIKLPSNEPGIEVLKDISGWVKENV